MVTTKAILKANAKYRERKRATGWRWCTFYLNPSSIKALDKLKKKHGSKNAAVNAALKEAEK